MKPNEIHQSIAQQIDHMKPDHLKPGIDIGIEIVDRTAIGVIVRPTEARAIIRLDEGRDTYVVKLWRDDIDGKVYDDVYCDQLGELVFGDEAKPWTQPIVMMSDDDGETWEVIA